MDTAALKAAYDQTQFLSDKISNVDRDLLHSQASQNTEGLKSQYNQTKDILEFSDRSQYANENRQNRNFQLLNDGIKEQGSSTRDTVYKTSAVLGDAVAKTGSDNLLTTERVGSHIDDNIYRTASGIDQNIYRTSQDTRARMAEQFSTVQDGISRSQLENQKSTNELIGYLKTNNDHNWSNFGNVTKDIYQGKADTILSTTNQYAILAKQASDNTASIQIEAMKNKGDLAKQMAFEYSDLKDKIYGSEASIKELLRTQESDRLRDVLRATEHKSLYFELKDRHHHHKKHH